MVFETKSLPKTDTKAEDWIRRNAMKCIHWTISEIEEHYSEIEPEELCYENTATPDTEQQVDYANDTSAVFDLSKVVGLRETHLVEAITGEPEETSGENYGHDKSDFLHESFMQVAAHEVSEKIKRLPEKETRQQSLLSDMESEYESDNDPRSPSVVSSRNAYKYHKKIFNQLQFSFYRAKLEPCHLYNFRYMQKTSKSNQEGNDEFEAWMLVAGEKREGFNYSLFFEQFPDAKQHIFRIREIVNIQVMREFDIVQQYAQNDGTSQEIPNNVNESDNDPRSPSVVLSGNGYKYHKKVFDQLQSSFYQPKLEPYHLYNFRDIQRNSKSSQEGNDKFEAWMLVVG